MVARMLPVAAGAVVTGTTVSLSTSSGDACRQPPASSNAGINTIAPRIMVVTALQSPVRDQLTPFADRPRPEESAAAHRASLATPAGMRRCRFARGDTH